MNIAERFPSKSAFLRYQSKVQFEWEQFASGKTMAPDSTTVPFRIAESWKRCREYGLNPFRYVHHVHMKNLNMEDREKSLLTSKSMGFLIEDLSKKYAINVNIYDAQGNDIAVMPEADHRISFANEMIMGTSAGSLSLLEDRLGCVLGPEHYSRFFHQWLCCAAPFHDSLNNIVGAICVSGMEFELLPMLIELTATFSDLCSLVFTLAHNSEDKDNNLVHLTLESIANMSAPIMYIDDQQKPKLLSQYAQNMLAQHKRAQEGTSAGAEKKIDLYLNERHSFAQISEAGPNDKRTWSLSEHELRTPSDQLVLVPPRSEHSIEFSDIVGSDPQLSQCIRFAKQAAITDFSVVLNGESGTGKELFAQAIHNASPRKSKPFVALNCGAVSSDLVESELFGYVAGSFTDASRKGKVGLLEKASGGTLFLDEVESMPLSLQAKLLRVLSSGTLTQVGSTAEIPVDLRVISASKIDLRKAAEERRFREDLYYRISVVSLSIPPLRERREDIPALVHCFLNSWGHGNMQVEEPAMQALCDHNWPGNVRELENVLMHAVVFSQQGVITIDSLPEDLLVFGKFHRLASWLKEQGLITEEGAVSIQKIEMALIRSVLSDNSYVISRAAQALNIDRKTLYKRISGDPELAEPVARYSGANS